MEEFLTWDVLSTYASFVTIVFMVVEFTKDLKGIKKIPTKYWSFSCIISFNDNFKLSIRHISYSRCYIVRFIIYDYFIRF